MNRRRDFAKWILHLLCRKGYYEDRVFQDKQGYFERGFESSAEFFRRLDGRVDFKGKTVLDVGCGLGSTCFYMVLNGAEKAVGVDVNEEFIAFAQSKLQDCPSLHGAVEFKSLSEMDDAKFDIVVSKDSFEHYENPEKFMATLKLHMKAGGKLVIGFSPLWKSPYGGHIQSLSRWPWIHILFPESLLIVELRRFLKDDSLQSFKDIAGGLNKMIANRYLRIVRDNGLEFDFLKINASSSAKDRCVLTLFKGLRLIPFLKEYFTVNIYSILRIRKQGNVNNLA